MTAYSSTNGMAVADKLREIAATMPSITLDQQEALARVLAAAELHAAAAQAKQ